MRRSPLRHPLAVLRQLIGLSQRELARLVGKSTATIQAIELGKLSLSEELALKISLETGVSARWLLNGDPQAQPMIDSPPLGSNLGVFTKEIFEHCRAERMQNRDAGIIPLDPPWYESARLNAIREAAAKSGSERLARYRTLKFLDELEREFGISNERFEQEERKWKLWNEFESLFEDPDSGYETKEDGEPPWASYREFVPSFIKEYERLAKSCNRRIKQHNLQEPSIFPLLRWASRAVHVISPSVPHKLLRKKSEGAAKASGSSKRPA